MARQGVDLDEGAVLAVDVGNTTTRLGVAREGRMLATWDATTPERLTCDEALVVLRDFFAVRSIGSEMAGAIVSSVVPALTDVWVSAAGALSRRRPLTVGPGLKTGLRMLFDDPGEVGSDRIADMVAAREIAEGPVVVVDFGTTTNFEVIDETGAFAGGIIAPGLRLSLAALATSAAKLTMVEIKAPATAIGRNTRTAMQSGAVLGEIARIDGLIDFIWDELGYSTDVIMSGDDASALCALSSHDAFVVDDLTLKGLFRLERLNRRKQ